LDVENGGVNFHTYQSHKTLNEESGTSVIAYHPEEINETKQTEMNEQEIHVASVYSKRLDCFDMFLMAVEILLVLVCLLTALCCMALPSKGLMIVLASFIFIRLVITMIFCLIIR
jgi:uncharacterized protein YqhQ